MRLYEILAVSNGLVLVNLKTNNYLFQYFVCNPITKQHIKLPELSMISFYFLQVCDFFEHDLQSSSYKIFLASLHGIYIYSSSFYKWQAIDSFSNFKLNLEFKLGYPLSCIMYKNNIYIAFTTTKFEWMMVVYNPKDDAWSNLGLGIRSSECSHYGARLIIANDHLFLAHVCYYTSTRGTIISIFEIKIEDRLFIPITKITCQEKMTNIHGFPYKFIFGLGNKITIMRNINDVGITFNLSTNELQEFRNNDFRECNFFGIYPFKYTLVSP